MKVSVWFTRDYRNIMDAGKQEVHLEPAAEGFEVWSGEMECTPREGELITVWEGWLRRR